MRKAAFKLIALLMLAGCQTGSVSDQSAPHTQTSETQKVASLDGYSGTWQVDFLGGSTQIDIKPVGGRHLGYADRYINGQTVAAVETRLSNGRIYMDWDVDQSVETSPDITMKCDVVEPEKILNCTGWPLQGRKRWRKVSDDYLVEARSGKSDDGLVNGGESSGTIAPGEATEIAGLVQGSSCGYEAGPQAARIYADAARALSQVKSGIPETLSQAVATSDTSRFSCSQARSVINERIKNANEALAVFHQTTKTGTKPRFTCNGALDSSNPSHVIAAQCSLAGFMTELVATAELCHRHCS